MATNLTSKFNQGKLTTTDFSEQPNDKFWSKGAIKEAKKKTIFTQLGDKLTQPKHFGDEIVKERHYPVLHPMNQIDNNINANAAQIIKSRWYAYDANDAMVGSAEGYPTKADADGVAGADSTKTKSGAGNLFNGDADYAVLSSSYPVLSEEGGNVNAVNAKSVLVKGKVEEYGIHMSFTQRSIDMDSRNGILAQKTLDLGEAKGQLFEAQVQTDLIAASEVNRLLCGDAASIADIGSDDVLTYADLRNLEQHLKKQAIPRNTKVITGSTKIGTKVVSKAYYIYVGQELFPTLQDMTHTVGATEVRMWEPVESYMDGAKGNIAEGEIGRIGAFRFIEVENMQKYKAAGADATDATDDADVGNRYVTDNGSEDHYDVFPLLVVGSDSFATVGFAGDSARIKTSMPKPIPGIDPFGKNGSISISYFHGTLIYRPERILQLLCSAKIA